MMLFTIACVSSELFTQWHARLVSEGWTYVVWRPKLGIIEVGM